MLNIFLNLPTMFIILVSNGQVPTISVKTISSASERHTTSIDVQIVVKQSEPSLRYDNSLVIINKYKYIQARYIVCKFILNIMILFFLIFPNR